MTHNKIKRSYGKERTFGDIIYNPQTRSVFCSINLGFFGKTTVTLVKRAEDGAYDLMKNYKDRNGQEQIVCVGKTFPSKKRDDSIVDGLTQGTLGLFQKYNAEKQKELTDSSDALFITTHKLKEPKAFGENGLKKIGYITGKFGIEDDIASNNGSTSESYVTSSENTPDYMDDNEEILF